MASPLTMTSVRFLFTNIVLYRNPNSSKLNACTRKSLWLQHQTVSSLLVEEMLSLTSRIYKVKPFVIFLIKQSIIELTLFTRLKKLK